MFRRLWLILATIAVANALALGMFLGWLAASDRLDMERLRETRGLFVRTRAQETADEERAAREAEAAAAEAERRSIEGLPPITAEQRMRIIRDYAELINQRTERTKRETQDLIDTLMAQQTRLERERRELEADRAAFERMRSEIVDLVGSEQFEKTLRIYETVKPEVAASMMRELLARGETDQVVAYLDAMKSRSASAVIGRFEEQDPALAADLLERLRVHGLVAQAREAD
jgi:flagellar motility protein MotE (MotC chaperone)